MTIRERLTALLSDIAPAIPWMIPGRTRADHFKRITIAPEERARLAEIGGREIFTAYGARTYYTQAIIAGAMLSGDYDRLTVVTPWQYGKSWLMGHASLLLARRGMPVYVGANTGELTSMIMGNAYTAVRDASQALKAELVGDSVRKVDKIGASLSRQRIGFTSGGAVEALTLGGVYEDTAHNKAVGKGGAYILDEAALIPDSVYAETLRSNFARTDGKRYLQVAISNPHASGWFYDDLTKEDPDPRHLIIWMDALTAVQDGRWTAEHILEEAKTMRPDEIQRYLLCELPTAGSGLFGSPTIGPPIEGRHFLGVDSAYKGKDNITIADIVVGEHVHVNDIAIVNKKDWIDGVTSEDIADTIARVYRSVNAGLVCVDVGQGIWLVEALTRRGVNVQGVYFNQKPTPERVKMRHYSATNALNLRAEMHLDLSDLMENGLTWSETSAGLVKGAFPYITATRGAKGKIKINEKPEIKAYMGGKSPDELDAVLLGIRAAVLGGIAPAYIT